MNKKIILVSMNARYSHSNLALLYLEKALEISGTADYIHLEWDINRPLPELMDCIFRNSGDVIVFSAYIWNAEQLMKLIPDLSAVIPDAVICAGGPEAAYNREAWTDLPGLDYILDGNAENFAEILPTLGKILTRPPAQVISIPRKPLRETPFPYTAERLKNLAGRLIYYEAARGCLFSCSYCLSAAEPTTMRNSPPESGQAPLPDRRTGEQIETEIRLLSGFRGTVKFVDRSFNADKSVCRQVWRLMAAHPPAGCFHFELHPLLLQEEDFRLIENLPPGSAQFEIGIQSTSPRVLENVNRRGCWRQEQAAVKRLLGMKAPAEDGASVIGAPEDGAALQGTIPRRFQIHLDQIAGLPGDTLETAAQSLDDIMSLQPDVFQLGFLKLLPGTPLAADKDRFGLKAAASPPYQVLETADFAFSELMRFQRIEKLINRLYNSGFFRLSLPFLAERAGGWYSLFSGIETGRLLDAEPEYINRRWEYWGLVLYKAAERIFRDFSGSKSEAVMKDLLRFDWCPFAAAQRYPDFIQYPAEDDMHGRKTAACRILRETHPSISKGELKRSILFIPESGTELLPKTSAVLVVRSGGVIQYYTIDKKRLQEQPYERP